MNPENATPQQIAAWSRLTRRAAAEPSRYTSLLTSASVREGLPPLYPRNALEETETPKYATQTSVPSAPSSQTAPVAGALAQTTGGAVPRASDPPAMGSPPPVTSPAAPVAAALGQPPQQASQAQAAQPEPERKRERDPYSSAVWREFQKQQKQEQKIPTIGGPNEGRLFSRGHWTGQLAGGFTSGIVESAFAKAGMPGGRQTGGEIRDMLGFPKAPGGSGGAGGGLPGIGGMMGTPGSMLAQFLGGVGKPAEGGDTQADLMQRIDKLVHALEKVVQELRSQRAPAGPQPDGSFKPSLQESPQARHAAQGVAQGVANATGGSSSEMQALAMESMGRALAQALAGAL